MKTISVCKLGLVCFALLNSVFAYAGTELNFDMISITILNVDDGSLGDGRARFMIRGISSNSYTPRSYMISGVMSENNAQVLQNCMQMASAVNLARKTTLRQGSILRVQAIGDVFSSSTMDVMSNARIRYCTLYDQF